MPNQDQTPESIPQRNHNSSSGRIRTSSSSSISDSAFLPVVSGINPGDVIKLEKISSAIILLMHC